MCPLYGPGNDMKFCKVMQAQAKYMKYNWLTIHSGRAGHVSFKGAKKRLAEGQDLISLVANAVKNALKANKHVKATAAHDQRMEKE